MLCRANLDPVELKAQLTALTEKVDACLRTVLDNSAVVQVGTSNPALLLVF